jgi:hypothetical protein
MVEEATSFAQAARQLGAPARTAPSARWRRGRSGCVAVTGPWSRLSSPDHPGHTVFPLLATLLSTGPIADGLLKELDATGRDVVESFPPTNDERKRTLDTPSIASLVRAVRPGIVVANADANAAIDAMRTAADKRTKGILGNSRRQHYAHAALLVASCLAFAPKGRYGELTHWAAELRRRYWRRHAFRQELTRAFDALGVREVA